MFLVKNQTKGKVLIGDLNLTMTKDEEIDLDTLYSREVINASTNLKIALKPDPKKNKLATLVILHKDEEPAPRTTPHPDDIAEMEKRIREQIAKEIASQVQPNQDSSQNSDLSQKMDLILKALASGLTTTPKKPTEQITEIEPDDDKMLDIHKRSINRITKGATGHVQSDKGQNSMDVDKTANELDGLI